ncbi:MAG: hypothetical protein WA860_14035 [Acidimicrobiales bacterium]
MQIAFDADGDFNAISRDPMLIFSTNADNEFSVIDLDVGEGPAFE